MTLSLEVGLNSSHKYKILSLHSTNQSCVYIITHSNLRWNVLWVWLKTAAAEAEAADAKKLKNRKECNKLTYSHVSRPISHIVLGHSF